MKFGNKNINYKSDIFPLCPQGLLWRKTRAEILIALEPDKFYHIYNHAVGKENFFENDANYKWFLGKFIKYAVPVCDVFAFSLMPNHFHFTVRIKSDSAIIPLAKIRSVKT
ncbi:MAG: hypothetical protein ABIT08_16050, partial [Bacteroidia bacterium]